jgi:sugar lactone lactonase YvrE
MKPELLLDAKAELGEGPAWDEKSRSLYWINIHAGEIHHYQPLINTDRIVFKADQQIGCVVQRKTGGLALATRSGFATLDLETGILNPLFNPETHLPGNRFNDGKCDPYGRFLAGSMDDAEVEASGSLYSLSPNGSLKTLISGVRISNGLAWSPDYRTFYYIDTPTHIVMGYDYNLETGDISNPRSVIQVPPEMGWPDGMTSDREGNLWVAFWGGAKIVKWNPLTARPIQIISFPALNVTSCSFGGEKLNKLYVTSARIKVTDEQLAQYPYSGGLFCIETDVEGMPTFAFG